MKSLERTQGKNAKESMAGADAEKALPKAVRRVSVPQLLAQNTEKSIAQKSARG